MAQEAVRTALYKADGGVAHQVVTEYVEFTEADQGAAGTYSATINLPAGAVRHDVKVIPVALWDDATSATLNVGDNGDDNGYFAAIDLKTTDLELGEELNFVQDGGKAGVDLSTTTGERWSRDAAASSVSFTVAVGAGGGSAGRTICLVEYSVPLDTSINAATFAAS